MTARVHGALATLVLLASCGASRDVPIDELHGALSGLRVSIRVWEGDRGPAHEPIPGAVAGIALGSTLMESGSMRGRETDEAPGDVARAQEDTLLLQRIVDLLTEEILHVLNRSTDRALALDELTREMAVVLEEGQSRLRDLQNHESDLKDDERRLRSGVRKLQGQLEDALSGGEPVSATFLIEDIVARQTELAQAETELLVTSELVSSFEEALEPLEERLEAVTANREALIAGVKVIELPGVEDLGVLEVIDGRARLRRR